MLPVLAPLILEHADDEHRDEGRDGDEEVEGNHQEALTRR
jgi:hypothetical protein